MADIWDQLRKELPSGEVLTPSDPGYEDSLNRWSRASVRRADAVVRPASADEAAAAVRLLAARKVPFTVCGGGHSTSGASSAGPGGVVVDLRRLNAVQVDTAARTVTFGGGCRWVQIDEACAEHGLATVGGTVNDTGVGGLTLGGGFGWLSGKYGLVIDNLVRAEVVLADGRVVVASEAENADLFWAVRGAGQNFGIVTSFTLKLYPQGNVWGGILILALEHLPQVVQFANDFHETSTEDQSWGFGPMGGAPGVPVPVIMCLLFHNGSREEGERLYKPLLDLGPLANLTKEVPYAQMGGIVGRSEYGLRRLQGGSNFTMPLKLERVTEICDTFLPWVKDKGIGEGSVIVFEILRNEKLRAVGIEDTAFAARGDYFHIGTMFSWKDEELDGEVRAFNRKLVAMMKGHGIKDGVGQYNNYDGTYIGPENAFGVNLKRLRELKTKYDPDNVFSKWNGVWGKSDNREDPA